MGTYDTAKICTGGHKLTSSMEISENTNKYCEACGKPAITQCPACGSPIHGDYNEESVLSHRERPIPAYCYECGRPYPWTASLLQTADNIISAVEGLTPEQKQQLKEFLPDIVIETPRTLYADVVFGKLMPLVRGIALEAFKAWSKEHVLPKVISLINPYDFK